MKTYRFKFPVTIVMCILIFTLSIIPTVSAVHNTAPNNDTTATTFYLPFEPEARTRNQPGVTLSRTGTLYRNYYTQAGINTVVQDNCIYVLNDFCLGWGGDYHDYGDSYNWERGAFDFRLPYGTPILAAASGTVDSRTNHCQIVIRHDDNTVAYYIHMSEVSVEAGTYVEHGDLIGKSGSDPCGGGSTGPHLHFAVYSGLREIAVQFQDSSAQEHSGYIRPSKSSGSLVFPYQADGDLPPENQEPSSGHFRDVGPDHPFYRHIELLHYLGISKGYTGGYYRPDRILARGEFAVMIARTLGEEGNYSSGSCPFTDVCSDHSFYSQIRKLKELGIFRGFSDGSFRPDDEVSREEMATVIIRSRVYAELDSRFPDYSNCVRPFPDVSCNNNHYDAIRRLKEVFDAKDIGLGYSNGTFFGGTDNDAKINRGGIAKILIHGMDLDDQLPTFYDVLPDHPFYEYVENLYERGLTRGCTSSYEYHKKFCADRAITRGETATFIIRGLGEEPSYGSCSKPFPDVGCSNVHYPYIRRLKELGATNGFSDGTYRPNNSITRAEIAKLIVLALESKGIICNYDLNQQFPDVPGNHQFYRNIQCLKELSITSGYSDGKYYPDRAIDRGAAAKFMDIAFIRISPEVPQEESDVENDRIATAPVYEVPAEPNEEPEVFALTIPTKDQDHIKIDTGSKNAEDQIFTLDVELGTSADVKLQILDIANNKTVVEKTGEAKDGTMTLDFEVKGQNSIQASSLRARAAYSLSNTILYLIDPNDIPGKSDNQVRRSAQGQNFATKQGVHLANNQPDRLDRRNISTLNATAAIANGGFESGSNGWTELSTNDYGLIFQRDALPITPKTGNWAAWLAGVDNETSNLLQAIAVPQSNPKLHFWYQIDSTDSCGYDFGGIMIDSNTVETFDLCVEAKTSSWQERVIDLSNYAGQTVDLRIIAQTDVSAPSSFFIDDISISGEGGTDPGTELVLKVVNTNPHAKEGTDIYLSITKKDESVQPNQATCVSSTSGGKVTNLRFGDEDILCHNSGTEEWSILFDGSAAKLPSKADINAFHILDDGNILMSFDRPFSIQGLGKVDDSDIVKYNPNQGTWERYFTGKKAQLTKGAEDIDAFFVLPNGDIVISTIGTANVKGVTKAKRSDMIAFTPTQLGANTKGTWRRYFTGKPEKLTSKGENIWGTAYDSATGQIYFTTRSNFKVTGLNGKNSEIIQCVPNSGEASQCTFSSYWKGADFGFGGENLDGIHIMSASTVRAATFSRESVASTPSSVAIHSPDEPSIMPNMTRILEFVIENLTDNQETYSIQAENSSSWTLGSIPATLTIPAGNSVALPIEVTQNNQAAESELTLTVTAQSSSNIEAVDIVELAEPEFDVVLYLPLIHH